MANEQNLILKDSNQSREEAKINGRKGGIASGKARRERRTFRELAEMLGAMQANEKTRANVQKVLPTLKDKDISYDVAIVVNNLIRASNGDSRASEWLSKIRGEVVNRTELTGKDGEDLFKGMTDEELEARIKSLERV